MLVVAVALVVLLFVIILLGVDKRYQAVVQMWGRWLIYPVKPDPKIRHPVCIVISPGTSVVEYADGATEKINTLESPVAVKFPMWGWPEVEYGAFRVQDCSKQFRGGVKKFAGLLGSDYFGVRDPNIMNSITDVAGVADATPMTAVD